MILKILTTTFSPLIMIMTVSTNRKASFTIVIIGVSIKSFGVIVNLTFIATAELTKAGAKSVCNETRHVEKITLHT